MTIEINNLYKQYNNILAVKNHKKYIKAKPYSHIQFKNFLDKKHEVNRKVHEIAESLGGSFSAEHGIGTKLKDDLVFFSDPVKIQLMQSLKLSIDPNNIMNPNKLIKI